MSGLDGLYCGFYGRLRLIIHTEEQLLQAEILIVEHLCGLEQLPDEPFCLSALPPKFKGAGTFPVRALAKLP
jgi:kynurenine formamidase